MWWEVSGGCPLLGSFVVGCFLCRFLGLALFFDCLLFLWGSSLFPSTLSESPFWQLSYSIYSSFLLIKKNELTTMGIYTNMCVCVRFLNVHGGFLMVPIIACKNSQFWARENHKSIGNKNCLPVIHAEYYLNSPRFIN